MATPGTVETTQAPAEHRGLPQLDPASFPSQLFWLAITFGLLLLVLARVSVPRVAGIITERRRRIDGDLEDANRFRNEANSALQSYETALAQARGRALQLAEENRKRVMSEIDALRKTADAQSLSMMSAAETRIEAERLKSQGQVRAAAAEAAAAIVERLMGESVDLAEAQGAIEAPSPATPPVRATE